MGMWWHWNRGHGDMAAGGHIGCGGKGMNTWEQGTWGYRDGGTGMGDMVTGAGGHRDTVEKGQGTQGHSGVGVAGHGEQQCGNRGHGHMVAWG